MPNYFDFYEGDIYHEYRMTKKGYCMHRYGFCSEHIQFEWVRISQDEYVTAYETYKGY